MEQDDKFKFTKMMTDRKLDIFTKKHQYISHNFHKLMEL